MKRTFFNSKVHCFLLVVVVCIGLTNLGYGQAVVSVNPTAMESTAVGEQFTVNIDITGGQSVAAYQVTVNFDPTALKYVSSANADYLPEGAIVVPPKVSNNNVVIAALGIGQTAPDGDGTLATVLFEVIAVKASSIELTDIRLVDTDVNVLAVTSEDGMITAPVVPIQYSFEVTSYPVEDPILEDTGTITFSLTANGVGQPGVTVELTPTGLEVLTLERTTDVLGQLPVQVRFTNSGTVRLTAEVAISETETQSATVEFNVIPAADPLAIADIALIIDSSGSMDWNDPNNLRKAAANLLIDLAAPAIQIAIIDFNGTAKTYSELTFADNVGKNQLKNAVDRIDSNGDTDIAAGLHLGYDVLSASIVPSAKKVAVLLTDGQDSELKSTSFYVQDYVAQGWTVYTVGLGDEVDRDLLTAIATFTPEGEYFQASLDNIQTIYQRVFARVTRKSIISNHIGYINQNQQITKRFLIDSSIEQIVPSANWQGSTIDLILIDPNGVEITSQDAIDNPNVTFESAPTFAIYTIDNPMPGEWGMKAIGTDIPVIGEQYQLTVSATSDFVTNMLSFEPSYILGDTVHIGIRAQSKSGESSEPVLGATSSAEVVRPDGRIDTLDLVDVAGNGVYIDTYTDVDIEGTYLIRASVHNGFSREIQEQIVVGDIINIFIDGSTLTPAAGASLDISPSVISAVISGPAGEIDSESIALQVDGANVSHGYDSVNQIVLFRPSGFSAGEHKVKLSVNNNLETTWTFTLSQPDSRFELLLDPGLNVVSLPLMPRDPYTAKSFSELLSATVVIRHDSTSQEYIAYVAVDDTVTDEGFAIEGGRGYIVNTPTATAITFIGTAWSNQPVSTIGSPSLHLPTTTWAFVLSSDVRGMAPDTNYVLVAKNLRTGVLVTEDIYIGKTSSNAVWANQNRRSVVQVDDILEITLHDTDGNSVSGPFQQKVSMTDIHNAYIRIQMSVGDVRPENTILSQNYPNPFNPETWIPYQLSKPAPVSIRIYDSVGNLVRTLNLGFKSAGIYMAPSQAAYWDGKNDIGERVASGIYFYTLQTPEFTATRKMVILK